MTEAQTHRNICDYLKLQYPEVIFRTDFASGMKLTVGQARKHASLQSGRSWPDLFIAEPRAGFHGLFIEVKKDGITIKKKDGNYVKDTHIREQALMLYTLGTHGYMATFGVGFDHCKQILDEYLGLPKPNYTPPEYDIQLPEPDPIDPNEPPF